MSLSVWTIVATHFSEKWGFYTWLFSCYSVFYQLMSRISSILES